jgi:uncharacterized protein YdaU (DUF1376 family)
MTDIAWYPFYVGDYSRKTAHLSLLEHGAYRLLMDHYYATRHPLPNDPAKLYRICRARSPSERKAVLSVVAEYFIESGSLMRHEKCDSEITKQLKYSDVQSANAKRRHSDGTAMAMPRGRVPQSQPQPDGSEAKASSPPPTPKVPKVSLADLSVDHIADWLAEKRAKGRYLMHDEHFILDQFKNYCQSKGKKYADFIAGYRNAFEWERCQPGAARQGKPDDKPKQSSWLAEGERLAAKYRAEAERERQGATEHHPV